MSSATQPQTPADATNSPVHPGRSLFLIVVLAASVLVCLGLVLQLPPQLWPATSSLPGAPSSKLFPLFLILEGPYLLAIVIYFLAPRFRAFALGAIGGNAVFHLIQGGPIALGLALDVYWNTHMGSHALDSVYGSFVAYLFLQVVLLVLLLWHVREAWAGRWACLVGVVVVSFLPHTVTSLREMKREEGMRFSEAKRREFAHIQESVRTTGLCIIQYSAVHPDRGYPAHIEDLSGSGCQFDWPPQDALEYRFSYQPSVDASGRVRSFLLQAITDPEPVYSPLDFAIGPSGQLLSQVPHVYNPNRWSPPYTPTLPTLDNILRFHFCLEQYADAHPDTGYPEHLDDINWCFNGSASGPYLLHDSVTRDNYALTYVPELSAKSGRVRNYTLQSRCLDYGKACVRSFYADAGGATATPFDRPATINDPPTPECDAIGPPELCAN